MQEEQWKMPAWMEKYRDLFVNTGGNSVEELMNMSGREANLWNNAPLAALCIAVESQVVFLDRLRRAGMLAREDVGND